MEYDSELLLLSSKFIQDYPPAIYPELMYKCGRPYTCLLIDSHYDFFICIPFRSSIKHQNAFMFSSTVRSKKTKSGLDYSKIIIINDNDYLNTKEPVIIDQDEYIEMIRNLPTIAKEANDYVDSYVNHIKKKSPLHPKAFIRKYQYSSLPYFHNIMGI